VDRMRATSPSVIAEAIVKAATASRPPVRHSLPLDARLFIHGRRLLGDRFLGWVVRKLSKLPYAESFEPARCGLDCERWRAGQDQPLIAATRRSQAGNQAPPEPELLIESEQLWRGGRDSNRQPQTVSPWKRRDFED
jgi:hypothetical protein